MADGIGEGMREGMGEGDKAKPRAASTPANEPTAAGDDTSGQANDTAHPSIEAVAKNLPMVIAPRLAGDETIEPELEPEAADESRSESADDSAAAPQARSSRFALLAASVALAAAFGSFAGIGAARLLPGVPLTSPSAEMTDALRVMNLELAELTSLKASLDGASRGANTQFAKITDRLDRVERAQTDPAMKLAHIADAIDRLDKRGAAASEITGSITAVPPPSPPSAQTSEPRPPLLEGWVVEGVQNGRALVASRNGGVFEVGAGSFLPGLGRVQTVKHEDGQWLVITARGVITSGR